MSGTREGGIAGLSESHRIQLEILFNFSCWQVIYEAAKEQAGDQNEAQLQLNSPDIWNCDQMDCLPKQYMHSKTWSSMSVQSTSQLCQAV